MCKCINISISSFISTFLNEYDLKINGDIFNASNAITLSSINDLIHVPNKEGVYFIFSTLPETSIYTWHTYDGYQSFFTIGTDEYCCLYNGSSQHIRQRIKQHIFNSKTPLKLQQGQCSTLEGTGSLSLEAMTQQEFDNYCSSGIIGGPSIGITGSVQPAYYMQVHGPKGISSLSHKKYPEGVRFYNGINCTEPQWQNYKFAVVIITIDDPILKSILELGFRKINGTPPLCKYLKKA